MNRAPEVRIYEARYAETGSVECTCGFCESANVEYLEAIARRHRASHEAKR